LESESNFERCKERFTSSLFVSSARVGLAQVQPETRVLRLATLCRIRVREARRLNRRTRVFWLHLGPGLRERWKQTRAREALLQALKFDSDSKGAAEARKLLEDPQQARVDFPTAREWQEPRSESGSAVAYPVRLSETAPTNQPDNFGSCP